ncbi:hypothetical protein [Limnoglobus roseus]|uniref:Uncharacterized protein n=1 Tax=Limnoglobus roseus TaxID=2598579 RepID=A0A5C1AQ05_9BACT|nr:hypothetical protein [Limnoglobus roseus]QEL19842.1 hypothetical protein PX52LOC_06923 [Limnoglobus roseus]
MSFSYRFVIPPALLEGPAAEVPLWIKGQTTIRRRGDDLVVAATLSSIRASLKHLAKAAQWARAAKPVGLALEVDTPKGWGLTDGEIVEALYRNGFVPAEQNARGGVTRWVVDPDADAEGVWAEAKSKAMERAAEWAVAQKGAG